MEHVVGAGPDVDKGQGPEPDHGQLVAVQGGVRGPGDEVVSDAEADRREDQAHGVMHVHPVQVGLVGARGEEGGEVAREVDEGRPEDAAHGVPDGHVHGLMLAAGHGHEDVDSKHDPGDHHEDVEVPGQLGILPALVLAGHEGDDGAQDDDIPETCRGEPKFFAPERHAAEPRDRVVGEAHVSRQKPAEEHAIHVQGAQAPVGEPGHGAHEVGPHELGGDDQGDDAHDEEVGH